MPVYTPTTDEIEDDIIETCRICGGCALLDLNLCYDCLMEEESGD